MQVSEFTETPITWNCSMSWDRELKPHHFKHQNLWAVQLKKLNRWWHQMLALLRILNHRDISKLKRKQQLMKCISRTLMSLKLGLKSPTWKCKTLWRNFAKTSFLELLKENRFLVKKSKKKNKLHKTETWFWKKIVPKNKDEILQISFDKRNFMNQSMICFIQWILINKF